MKKPPMKKGPAVVVAIGMGKPAAKGKMTKAHAKEEMMENPKTGAMKKGKMPPVPQKKKGY